MYCEDLVRGLQGTDLIANGVSSFGTEWFAQAVGPLLTPAVPVIAVTKGLAIQPDGNFEPLPELIDEHLPAGSRGKISLNAIGGPCIAHELAARRETCVIFAGRDLEILQRIEDVFSTSYYHIWTSIDLHEVEICSALKNAYALVLGMAVGVLDRAGPDGLAGMYNPQAALFAQSCREMGLLLKSQGRKEQYALGLAGAGDLYVTVYGGRTLMLGRLLGQGISFRDAMQQMAGITLESVETVRQVARAIQPLEIAGLLSPGQLPVMGLLDEVIRLDQPVTFPWSRFFQTLS
jgi:glycerol-3-phosphate dehydrogenase (NAD(P)+)